MTHPNTPSDIQARLAAAGLTLEDLAGLVPAVAPLADRAVETLVSRSLVYLERDNAGSYRTWAPYLKALASGAGFEDVCPCACPTCSTGECPCSTEGHHETCQPGQGETINCANRYTGRGDRDVDAITHSDIADLAWWTRRRALKRTVRRNANRANVGKPMLHSDGRGAAESAIAAARWFYGFLAREEITTRNPAAHVKLPTRQERPARALDVSEFLEVYRVGVTTGQDPDLDGLLLRHQLIQAVRRGGLLDATAGGIKPDTISVTYWDQKKKTYRDRPSTKAHIAHLMAHMIERGPRIAAPADAPHEVRRVGIVALTDDSPVFYRRPIDTFDENGNFLSREIRPVTRKRIESLFDRIKRHLEWARQCDLRPHDIRHTSGRLVYKASDQQMAALHLAHDAGSTTDHYLKERLEALAALKEALFSTHPNADGDPDAV